MQFFEDDEYGDYHNIDMNLVHNQIEELGNYAKLPLPIEEKIAHYQKILMNKKFAMDYRYEAVVQLSKIMNDYPVLVTRALVKFLDSDESEFNDPNYCLSKVHFMIDPYNELYFYSDENWFEDILDKAISTLNPAIPETKEAIHILIDIVKNLSYCEYINSTLQVLYGLLERHPDIRYIIIANLFEERKLNNPARLLLDYLEEYCNQINYFQRECFNEWFFDEIYSEEKYSY